MKGNTYSDRAYSKCLNSSGGVLFAICVGVLAVFIQLFYRVLDHPELLGPPRTIKAFRVLLQLLLLQPFGMLRNLLLRNLDSKKAIN